MTHSDICFARSFKERINNPNPVYNKGPFRLATNMLLQDENGKVLITRRAKTMRSWPGAWVLPGGHLDLGESLEESVAREIEEETGIHITVTSNGKTD